MAVFFVFLIFYYVEQEKNYAMFKTRNRTDIF